MTIENSFHVESKGLILAPDLPAFREKNWENFTDEVTIQTPSGKESTYTASFELAYFNIHDPKRGKDSFCRIVISLKGACKKTVPIGVSFLSEKKQSGTRLIYKTDKIYLGASGVCWLGFLIWAIVIVFLFDVNILLSKI